MSDDSIAEFWAWWTSQRDHILATLHTREPDWIDPLTERVHAIHPDLQWEFGPGLDHAPHHLCVTAYGDLRLRPRVERWRAAAPHDPDFEFYSARQAKPGEAKPRMIRWSGVPIPYEDFWFTVQEDDVRHKLDLTVFHPAFADLEDQASGSMVFVVLDDLIGEDAVMTWLGAIDRTLETPSSDALDADQFCARIAGLTETWSEPTWVIAKAVHPETELSLIFAGTASAKYLLDPTFDTLCQVRMPYASVDEGMPTPAEKERVDGFEEAVMEALGDRVRNWCRRTGNGERLIWLYLRAENGPARRALDRLADEHPGHVELVFSWDPGWRALPI